MLTEHESGPKSQELEGKRKDWIRLTSAVALLEARLHPEEGEDRNLILNLTDPDRLGFTDIDLMNRAVNFLEEKGVLEKGSNDGFRAIDTQAAEEFLEQHSQAEMVIKEPLQGGISSRKREKTGEGEYFDPSLVVHLGEKDPKFDEAWVNTCLNNFTLLEVSDAKDPAAAFGEAIKLVKKNIEQWLAKKFELGQEPEPEEIKQALTTAIVEAHQKLVKKSTDEVKGYVTTLTVALVDRKTNTVYYGHVGDSRLGVVRQRVIGKPNLKWITSDQTQAMGQIEGGKAKEIEPEVGQIKLGKKDRLILATDGLLNLEDEQIAQILFKSDFSGDDLWRGANELTKAAEDAGQEDNITTIVAETYEAQERRLGKRAGLLNKIRKVFKSEGNPPLRKLLNWAQGLIPTWLKPDSGWFREGKLTQKVAARAEKRGKSKRAERLRSAIRQEDESYLDQAKRLLGRKQGETIATDDLALEAGQFQLLKELDLIDEDDRALWRVKGKRRLNKILNQVNDKITHWDQQKETAMSDSDEPKKKEAEAKIAALKVVRKEIKNRLENLASQNKEILTVKDVGEVGDSDQEKQAIFKLYQELGIINEDGVLQGRLKTKAKLGRLIDQINELMTQTEQEKEQAATESETTRSKELQARFERLKKLKAKFEKLRSEKKTVVEQLVEKFKDKKLFKTLGTKFKELWDSIPKNKEGLEKWNKRRKEKREARWKAKKELYQKRKERWEKQLEIDNLDKNSPELQEWELDLLKGKTLQAKQIVALILHQKIGTSKKLFRREHRQALKEAGIKHDDLIDWLKFQWEKKLRDGVEQADEGQDKFQARLKFLNYKLYDKVRLFAVLEAGVDRFGRPNASGIAPEDIEGGWFKKRVGRYFENFETLSADRKLGYYLTYFPTLAGLLIAPQMTVMAKRIASAGIGTVGYLGSSLHDTIESQYDGDETAFWKDFEAKNNEGWGKFKVALAKLVSGSAWEQIAKGLQGAGGASVVNSLVGIEDLYDRMSEQMGRYIEFEDGELRIDFDGLEERFTPEEMAQIEAESEAAEEAAAEARDIAQEAEDRADYFEEQAEDYRERLETSQQAAETGPEAGQAAQDLAEELGQNRSVDLDQLAQEFTAEPQTVNRPVWSIFKQQADEFASQRPHNDSNSVAGTMTRIWRQLNPGKDPRALGSQTEVRFLNQSAREKMMEAILDAHDKLRQVGRDQLSEAERLLVAGEIDSIRLATFTDEQAALVLDHVLNQ